MFKFLCKNNQSSTLSPRLCSRTLQSKTKDLIKDNLFNNPKINSKEDFIKIYSITDKVIGTGGTCIVKKCIRNEDFKIFACKIIDKTQLSQRKMKIIRQEIDIMSKIKDSRWYLKLIHYYESDDKIYIITNYLEGGNLHEYIINSWNGRQYISQEDVCKAVFKQIIHGIHKLHRQNVVHRDIKAENIVFTSKNSCEIKIIDFGLAHVGLKHMTHRCGTPHYIAPEILLGKGYNCKVDWWACGVLLYGILSGRYPFYTKLNDRRFLYKCIVKGDYTFENTNLSPNAKDLITKLLNTNPKERIGYSDIIQHPWMKN